MKSNLNDSVSSPRSKEEMEFDDTQFTIIDDLHSKLQYMEQKSIETKQEAIENIRKISYLENSNLTLQAELKMYKESKAQKSFEEVQSIL